MKILTPKLHPCKTPEPLPDCKNCSLNLLREQGAPILRISCGAFSCRENGHTGAKLCRLPHRNSNICNVGQQINTQQLPVAMYLSQAGREIEMCWESSFHSKQHKWEELNVFIPTKQAKKKSLQSSSEELSFSSFTSGSCFTSAFTPVASGS